MSKLKNPLLSLDARGTLSKAVTFVKRRGQNIAEEKPEIKDVQSPAQLSWRHMYQKCAALWNALSSAEKETWESLARPKHMTGFAWFQSQCLRPNPGIYLPLQGGTMQGNIQMDGYHIHGLPLPIHPEDVWRRIDSQTDIEPYLYHEGARVTHSATLSVPDTTWTPHPFNTERWDTDAIHDNVVNNSRLTCKTAGRYIIIGQIYWSTNAVGDRAAKIHLNNTIDITFERRGTNTETTATYIISTIYHLSVSDFVELVLWQNSGGALSDTLISQRCPEFMMERIGA